MLEPIYAIINYCFTDMHGTSAALLFACSVAVIKALWELKLEK